MVSDVIHLPTLEEYMEFMHWCDANNLHWANSPALESQRNWQLYKERMCARIVGSKLLRSPHEYYLQMQRNNPENFVIHTLTEFLATRGQLPITFTPDLWPW